jgi:hypothetical protein
MLSDTLHSIITIVLQLLYSTVYDTVVGMLNSYCMIHDTNDILV